MDWSSISSALQLRRPVAPQSQALSPEPTSLDFSASSSYSGAKSIKTARASRPKVKSGCRCCRRRHVKCDETKPNCVRCLKYIGYCEGYVDDKIKGRLSTWSRNQKLLPKPILSDSTNLLSMRATGSVALPSRRVIVHNPNKSRFTDEREAFYFQYFCDRTATRLAGSFPQTLFDRSVLQICETEPSVRHAVIAIGALDFTWEINNAEKVSSHFNERLKRGTKYHEFALRQYGQAIKRLREFLSQEVHDTRTTLIACILFVCFEAFHGNNESAVAHARSGIKLLYEWVSKQGVESSWDNCYLHGLKSPVPGDLEDELVEVFTRLDITTITFLHDRPSNGLRVGLSKVCQSMPRFFVNLDQAKNYWYLVWRETLLYLRLTRCWGGNDSGLKFITSDSPGNHKFKIDQPKPYMQKTAISAIQRWSDAFFKSMLRDTSRSSGPKSYIAASLLEFHSRACRIVVNGWYEDEMYYDTMISQYEKLVSMVEDLQKQIAKLDSSSKAHFAFDGFSIGAVYAMALQCRHPDLRRRMIKWLKCQPRREGVWDSDLSATIATIVMTMEEKSMVGSFIPKHARLRDVYPVFNLIERKGQLHFARPTDVNQKYVLDKLEFSW